MIQALCLIVLQIVHCGRDTWHSAGSWTKNSALGRTNAPMTPAFDWQICRILQDPWNCLFPIHNSILEIYCHANHAKSRAHKGIARHSPNLFGQSCNTAFGTAWHRVSHKEMKQNTWRILKDSWRHIEAIAQFLFQKSSCHESWTRPQICQSIK